MAASKQIDYMVLDAAGKTHLVTADHAKVEDDPYRVTFYATATETTPVGSYQSPTSWGPAPEPPTQTPTAPISATS